MNNQDALACLTAAIDAGAFPLDDEHDLRALLAALVVTFPVTLSPPQRERKIGRKIGQHRPSCVPTLRAQTVKARER